MVRAPCCEKVGLKKGRWIREEDDILTKYIQENGEGCWRSVPKNAGLQRCGKSCRLRWINYLRPDLKRGNFSDEEKDMIIRLHATMGNRWSLIARQLNGRTDNEIKNYWNSHLSRKNLCDFKVLSCKAEVIAEWKQRRGRSRQRVSSKKVSVSAPLKHMNQEVGSIVAEKDTQAKVNEKSFQIAEYFKDEDKDNALSLDAEESIIFNENQSDFLFSIDDALSVKIKELDISTRNSNISSANQKTGMKPCDQEIETVTANDEAWADWDWKSVANGQKLIEDDEMLSMLLDDSSDFQLSNHY